MMNIRKNKIKNNIIKILSLTFVILFLFTSCSKIGSFDVSRRTVMQIDGKNVSYDEYKFFYYNTMQSLTSENTDWTNEENLKLLKDQVESALRNKYAKDALIKKYSITTTYEDNKEIDEIISGYIEDLGGKEAYEKDVKEGRATGRIYREQLIMYLYTDPYLREVLLTGIDDIIKMDDKTVKEDIMNNFYHYTQIFLPGGTNAVYEDNYMTMVGVYDKLKNGADFYDLAKKYSDWSVNAEIGVYSTPGEKIEELENSVLALEIGEYSGLVVTELGYHIFLRLPLDEEYVNKHLDELAYTSGTRRYNEYIAEYGKTFDVKYNSYYDTLTHEKLISLE